MEYMHKRWKTIFNMAAVAHGRRDVSISGTAHARIVAHMA